MARDEAHGPILIEHHNQLPPYEPLDISVHDDNALVRKDIRITVPDSAFIHLVPRSVE